METCTGRAEARSEKNNILDMKSILEITLGEWTGLKTGTGIKDQPNEMEIKREKGSVGK